MSSSLRPMPHPDVSAYPLDDDLVLFNTQTREGFVLNGTAARVWQLADGSRTPVSIARAVARAYGVAYGEALADVRDFVDELEGAGLLAGARKEPCAACPD